MVSAWDQAVVLAKRRRDPSHGLVASPSRPWLLATLALSVIWHLAEQPWPPLTECNSQPWLGQPRAWLVAIADTATYNLKKIARLWKSRQLSWTSNQECDNLGIPYSPSLLSDYHWLCLLLTPTINENYEHQYDGVYLYYHRFSSLSFAPFVITQC